MFSSYLNPSLLRLIFLFDDTFHKCYQQCMSAIKKHDYHSLYFMDENDHNINYTVKSCVRNAQGECSCWSQRGKNDCKGVLELNVLRFDPGNVFLYGGGNAVEKYSLFELVSSIGSDSNVGATILCLDLNELDWSMRKFDII